MFTSINMWNFVNDINGFLTEKWLPNLVGLIGGTLGSWSFIDNYVLKFKPNIYIGSQVFFRLKKNERTSRTEIDAILLSIEICNYRKKYGLIHDFAIKVYRSDEINPEVHIYYSSERASLFLKKDDNLEAIDGKPFNPVAILPNSNTSASLVVGRVNFSKMDVNSQANYSIEAYYKIKPDGKWRLSGKLNLYNVTASENYIAGKVNVANDLLVFTQLDYEAERELHSVNGSAVTSIYRGAYHRQKDFFIRLLRVRIYKPIAYIKDFFKNAFITFDVIQTLAVDKVLRLPAIKKYAIEKPRLNITVGNPKLSPITDSTLDILYSELEKIAAPINTHSKKEYHITLSKKGKGTFIISRYHMALTVYKSGDTSIRVQEENSSYGSKVRYNFLLKQGLLKKQYWYLENRGYMSVESFAIRIIDFLMLHFNKR
jgi:hypothetical protein